MIGKECTYKLVYKFTLIEVHNHVSRTLLYKVKYKSVLSSVGHTYYVETIMLCLCLVKLGDLYISRVFNQIHTASCNELYSFPVSNCL